MAPDRALFSSLCSLDNLYMSSSFDVPDSISFGDLEKLQAKAKAEMEQSVKLKIKKVLTASFSEEALCDLSVKR